MVMPTSRRSEARTKWRAAKGVDWQPLIIPMVTTDSGVSVQGIVTVSTVLYVEWGRLGEIGDLYVLPEHRRKGLARRLVEHAKSWCRTQGCSAVSVTITPAGERRHRLSQYYAGLGFAQSGRMSASATLDAWLSLIAS